MSDTEKPRLRSSPAIATPAGKSFVTDSYQNLVANLGLQSANQSSASTYGFNPLSRNRTKLEWMYRGSWLAKNVVNSIAEDMTREGTEIKVDWEPDQIQKMQKLWNDLGLWTSLRETVQWSRLYGGACALIDIDGQNVTSPLRLETIKQGQFNGLIVLDRWMLNPDQSRLIQKAGPEYGLPEFYQMVSDGIAYRGDRIHHSRLIRFDGVTLPYWQRIAENGWGLSVLEPFYDRMVAYDSATTGMAQLVYKAHLRTYKVEGYREIVASGGQVLNGFNAAVNLMRIMQTNEGIATIDAQDEMEYSSYTFSGLPEVMQEFGQQLAGAAETPLTRLFGMSPAGMNATGESDMRNYYDRIRARQQGGQFNFGVRRLYDVCAMSLFGKPLDENFTYDYVPLWQIDAVEQAKVVQQVAAAVVATFEAGIISQKTALKELRASSEETGAFATITDEDIENAEDEPPNPHEVLEMQNQKPDSPSGGTQSPSEKQNKPLQPPSEKKPIKKPAGNK